MKASAAEHSTLKCKLRLEVLLPSGFGVPARYCSAPFGETPLHSRRGPTLTNVTRRRRLLVRNSYCSSSVVHLTSAHPAVRVWYCSTPPMPSPFARLPRTHLNSALLRHSNTLLLFACIAHDAWRNNVAVWQMLADWAAQVELGTCPMPTLLSARWPVYMQGRSMGSRHGDTRQLVTA